MDGSMRLADFLDQEREAILSEWVQFASTMRPAADEMGTLALRDHAPKILEAISRDLRVSQTRIEQHAKSQGRAPAIEDAPETAAEIHAVLRARSGFDINQLVAEYRALRASVLRLWSDRAALTSATRDMMRFNEAIDQAIAESVTHFHAEVESARNLLLGMLGHDMRSPLSTVLMTAAYLGTLNAGSEVAIAADRLTRSGNSLHSLLGDLIDFSRTRLGLGLRVDLMEIDLATVVEDELTQLRGAHPDRLLELICVGVVHGMFDGPRVQQLLRNLVSNALLYGTSSEPIRIGLTGSETDVCLTVESVGPSIPQDTQLAMFEALTRGSDMGDGLGLGLYIVSSIAKTHGGGVTCRSQDGLTVFTVNLPRTVLTGVDSPSSRRANEEVDTVPRRGIPDHQ